MTTVQAGTLGQLNDAGPAALGAGPILSSALVRRRWPGIAALVVVAVGMAYSLLWGVVVQHGSRWVMPGDIWGTYRAAHYVGWGDIGDVYSPLTGLVTLPLITVVLAPVAVLTGHLGLSESLPFFLTHPTAWLVLGPVELLIGATVLFPLDALAEHLGVTAIRRLVLCVVEAVLVWPVVALWGHPEDALAMTFALYGLLAALRGKWGVSGWLWGAALATQPLVVLMLPIVFALAPVRRWTGLALKSVIPGVTLVLVPLLQQWQHTSRALLEQPNYPAIDHATPWVALAPVLSPAHLGVSRHLAAVTSGGRTHFTTSLVTSRVGEVVAAGPGRLIAMALSLAIGVWVYRSRPSAKAVVWCAALALALRCVFESVMNPYYLWPPLAVALLVAAGTARWRFVLTTVAATAVTVYSYHHAGPWVWWLVVVALLGVAMASSRPGRSTGRGARDAVVRAGEQVDREVDLFGTGTGSDALERGSTGHLTCRATAT